MKKQIKISVDVPDRRNSGQFNSVYNLVKVVDDSLDFDYKAVLLGLSVLYDDQSPVIHFTVM